MRVRRAPKGTVGGRSAHARLIAVALLGLTGVLAGMTASSGPSADAQVLFVPAELVSYEPNGAPITANASNLSLSTLGHVAAFERPAQSISGLMRVRPNGATVLAAPEPVENSGMSDDGCVLAYSGPQTVGIAAVQRTVVAFNRCTGGATSLGNFVGGGPLPRPSLNSNGSRIVHSVGATVVVSSLNGTTVTGQTPIAAPQRGWIITDTAMSDDGSTVAVTTGRAGTAGIAPGTSFIYLLDVASQSYTPISTSGNSWGPTISGDGSLVAYSDGGTAVVWDRSANVNRPVAAVDDPYISNDGRYLVARIFAGDNSWAFILTSSDRWGSASQPEMVSYPLPGVNGFYLASDPVVSEHGRWVGWISPDAYQYVDTPPLPNNPFRQVLVRERRPVLEVQSLAFGSTAVPYDLPATVRNVGPSGWRVTAIVTTSDFEVRSHDCPPVLHPGQTCTVVVRFLASNPSPANGELIVRDESYPGIPLAASGRLTGVLDPGTPGGGPSTTTTVPDDEVPPSFGLAITPSPVVFDDAVVGTAAPTEPATVRNTGTGPVTVQTVSIVGSAASDFAVVTDGCTSTPLPVGGTCPLELRFTPSTGGGRAAVLTVTGSGGTSAAAGLRGLGLYDATLRVDPEVATGGQVVAVHGEGFPASGTVQVTLGGSSPQTTFTDAAGRFTLQWLVLEGTPQGTLIADDLATSLFDAPPDELLVVHSAVRPQGTATRVAQQRNHVSR